MRMEYFERINLLSLYNLPSLSFFLTATSYALIPRMSPGLNQKHIFVQTDAKIRFQRRRRVLKENWGNGSRQKE